MKLHTILPSLLLAWSFAVGASARTGELQDLMIEAQDAYFTEPDLSVAKEKFARVADLRSAGPWEKSDTKIIHFALLRLAQISNDSEEKEKWLRAACTFAPQISPDSTVFPPPLVERYEEILREKRRASRPQPTEELNLQVSASPQAETPHAPLPLPQNSSPVSLQAPLWKNKWLWMGAGVIAAGVLMHQQQKSSPAAPAQPTVTHGL